MSSPPRYFSNFSQKQPNFLERFQNEPDLAEVGSANADAINEEDIFTEELVKNWFCEIMSKITNIHLIGLFLLAFFLYNLTLAFLIIYLMIYDTANILYLMRTYKKEQRYNLE